MSSRKLVRALLFSTVLCGSFASSALAQVVPPVRQSVDANGVDLFYGTMNLKTPEISIGGDQGLSYRLIWVGTQWRDSLTGSISVSGSNYVVSFGPYSDQFTLSGSTYVGTEGSGATLTYNGTNTYTYTTADGTVVTFSTSVTAGTGYTALVSTVVQPSGDRLSYNYESTQYCTSAKETEGDPICLTYATAYRLSAVTSSYGYRFELSHGVDLITPSEYPSNVDEWKRLAGGGMGNMAVASPTFRMMNVARTYGGGFTYDTVTDPLSRQTVYRSYGALLLGVKRPGSSSEDVTIAYAGGLGGGRVSSVTSAAGTISYAASDAAGVRTVTVTDPLSHTTTYTFDIASQRMTSVTDALSHTTSYQYDSKGRQTRVTMPEGNYVQTTYQSLDRNNVTQTDIVAKSGSGVATITTTASFDSTCSNPVKCNKPNSTTDAKGNVTDYTYDTTYGDLLTVTAPAPTTGAVRPKTTYSYSSVSAYYNVSALPGGSIVASGFPVRRVTGVSTCQTGASCVGTTDEVKTTISYGPQSAGTGNNLLPVSVSKGNGNGTLTATTAFGYDETGNRTSVDGPLAGAADTTTYRYDAGRQAVGVISADPDGGGSLKRRAKRATYNPHGIVTVLENGTVNGTTDGDWAAFASAQQLTTTLDAADRKAKDVLTGGGTTYQVTQYSYDAAGRLECTAVRMNSATWGTLPASACTLATTGSAGPDRITRTTYDNADRPVLVQTAYGTADQADEVATSYTNNGKVLSVTDGQANKTTYEYNGVDRLVKTRYPSPSTAGTSSTTDYEQLVYDPNGNVTSRRLRGYAADATQHIDFTYDNLNRVTLKDLPEANADVTYQYDLLGRPTTVANPGITHTIGYDALGRTTGEAQPFGSMSYQYDLAGNRTAQVWNDGFYVTYDHLVTGEVTAVRENGAASGVGVLATYRYDDLGRRTGITRGNGTTTSYGYDTASQLSSIGQDLAGTSYDLSLGFGRNPASQIIGTTRSNDAYAWTGATTANNGYGINGLNQVTSVTNGAGTATTGYDARGNLTSTGANSYAYTSENLMKSASTGTTLYYDVFGRLVEYDTSISTRFVYDGTHMASEVANPSGTVMRRYVYGPGADEPLVWYEGSGTSDRRWLHADERGSVIGVTNSSGAAIGINSYDEYGVPGSGNIGRFQYTGQAWLPELGLYYYKARMYSSRLGRFMQTDPIGYGGGMNWYNYVGGDSINQIDPSGLRSITCDSSGHCVDPNGNTVNPNSRLKPGDTVTLGGSTWNSDGLGGGFISHSSLLSFAITSSQNNEGGRDSFMDVGGDIVVTAVKVNQSITTITTPGVAPWDPRGEGGHYHITPAEEAAIIDTHSRMIAQLQSGPGSNKKIGMKPYFNTSFPKLPMVTGGQWYEGRVVWAGANFTGGARLLINTSPSYKDIYFYSPEHYTYFIPGLVDYD